MKALLDTNIIIHREATTVISQDIGILYHWLDKGHYIKCVHSASINEIKKNTNESIVRSLLIKLQSYETIQIPSPLHKDVRIVSDNNDINENDLVDSTLLNEVYVGRVDLLVSEDKKIHKKAQELGISSKVYTISSFLENVFADHPDLVDYKVLSVKKVKFGDLKLEDPFFDSLKEDYKGFEQWFIRKYDEDAYITFNSENGSLLSFLYLKIEDYTEDYSDISPRFTPKKRLKIGTFKVISNGFRLGERFLKIIFDNALNNKVDEIYLTVFKNRPEQLMLISLVEKWGFSYWGTKGTESIYVRDFSPMIKGNMRESYPYVSASKNIYLVPIYPEYHTELLPDSILNNESPRDFIESFPHRNGIEKVYVSRAYDRPAVGDILVFYRTGGYYKSVVTTLGQVLEVRSDFKNEEDFVNYCKKATVFPKDELIRQWCLRNNKPFVVRFLYIYSFPKRLNMKELIDLGVLSNKDDAPRGFRKIRKIDLKNILTNSHSDESFIIY